MSIEYNRGFGKLVRSATQSDIDVKVSYGPDDIKSLDYSRDLGNPGKYPFTRGIFPEMYRNTLWLKSQICCYSNPRETNEAFKKFIASGQTGLRILVDTTTHSSVDPDHPLGKYTITCNGTPTFAITEYREMFDGIPMENVDIENACACPGGSYWTYAFLIALLEERGGNISNLRGSNINDPIHAAIVFGSPEFADDQWILARKVNMDLIEFSAKNTPKYSPCTPCGYDMRDAGITAIQEVAYCIGNALQYYGDAISERGVKLDDFRPMAFSQSIESDFFEAVAKFRALRRMWSRVAKEKLGAKKERTMGCRIGARIAGNSVSMTQKPLNHTARLVLQTAAAVMGGVQSVDLASIDEAFGLPSEEARNFGLDASHIIAHEANIPLTADPLGGSYYVEWLTSKIEEEASKLLNEILEMGGMWEYLKSGKMKNAFIKAANDNYQEIYENRRLIIGYNAFVGEDGPISQSIKDSAYGVPCAEERNVAIEKVIKLREQRDKKKIVDALTNLWQSAKDGKNIVRPAIEACKSFGTVGELVGVLRLAYGYNYDPYKTIPTPNYISHLDQKRR